MGPGPMGGSGLESGRRRLPGIGGVSLGQEKNSCIFCG